MEEKQDKSFLQSVYGKVIATFIIGIVAIGLSGLVSKVGFREMLQSVESLSAPNEKLHIVNSLFYQVTQLEQLQHVNAIENPEETAHDFDPEVQKVLASMGTLRDLCRHDQVQLERLDTMVLLLKERQALSDSYFSLRKDLIKNQELSTRINDLTATLAKLGPKANKKVVTTSKKYITTTLVPPGKRKPEAPVEKPLKTEGPKEEKTSFISRLFGSGKKTETIEKPVKAEKPKKIKKGTTEVKEEVHVKVDTYSVPQHSRSLAEVERELRQIEKDYHERNAALLAQELALVKASHKLNRQLLDILKSFEAEEMSQAQGDFSKASTVMQASVTRMNIITVIFSLGAAIFAFLIVIDVARGNKLQKALKRAKEEAEHLSQVKQRFLANMSHELRTPLQSILGFAEQVRQEEKPKPEALDAIFFSAEHLLQIVNEVLDYSRIVSGKFTFVDQPFDLKQLSREVVNTLQPQAGKKNLKLNFQFTSPAGAYVSGDAFRLRQVLYNLLGNAIKFTDKGAVSLTVSSRQEGEKTMFSFKVKDTGIGIPEADLNRIFNQFEQVEGIDMQKYGGTGLGLSIVKSLVESQEGKLEVSSKMGEGSEFEILLPFRVLEQPKEGTKETRTTAEEAFSGEVLVVDDDAIILKLCGAILDKHKIKNTCLNSSQEAAETNWPDTLKVVFTDIQMPGMTGLELCKHLKQLLPEDVKIYALTAQALPEEHDELLAQGFDGILMKPFRENELLKVLNNLAAPAREDLLTDVPADFGAIGIIAGSDEQLALSMLDLFITETTPDLEMLSIYLAEDLPNQAYGVVHKLSGRVGQLGALQLSEKLKYHEKQLKKARSLKPMKKELAETVQDVGRLIALVKKRVVLLQEEKTAAPTVPVV